MATHDAFARMGASIHARLANATADIGPRTAVPVIYERPARGVLVGLSPARSSQPSLTCPTALLDESTELGAPVYVTTQQGEEVWELAARSDDADTGLTRLDLTEPDTP